MTRMKCAESMPITIPEKIYAGKGENLTRMLRRKFGYEIPERHYEALMDQLVSSKTRWLDIGCGRKLFPSNSHLSKKLSSRAVELVGIDPDETIKENPYVHTGIQAKIEDFYDPEKFDLISMRMVAEHVEDPASTARNVSGLLKPEGKLVVYTVNGSSLAPSVTKILPNGLKDKLKKALWGTEEKDTFPTHYRMNSREDLRKYLGQNGLTEENFWVLDDCRFFSRYPVLHFFELSARKIASSLRMSHLDSCLLGVYSKK